MKRARRSRTDIYRDILKFVQNEPKRATHIIYNCNMSWTGFQEMIGLLKQINLVHEINSPSGGRLFVITNKGRKLAQYSRKIDRLMSIEVQVTV